MKGIGPLLQMSLETYDYDADDSACDFKSAASASYIRSQRAWAFAHCDLAPISGKPERHTLWLDTN